MDAGSTSWIIGRFGPVVASSATGRVAVRAARLVGGWLSELRTIERIVARDGDRRLAVREPRITFEMLAPIVATSRVAVAIANAWGRLDAAARGSHTAAIADNAFAQLRTVHPATIVQCGAIVVAVASVTNIIMLLGVQRYSFPGHAVLFLPVVAAIVALVALLLSADIARGWLQRRR
jgi:hypothetical protein